MIEVLEMLARIINEAQDGYVAGGVPNRMVSVPLPTLLAAQRKIKSWANDTECREKWTDTLNAALLRTWN